MTNPRDKSTLVSKVNATPIGLQNLLGNVNQGINPHELDHKISPTVDLFPFWSQQKTRFATETGSVAGTIGQGIEIEVPEGELWVPLAMEGAFPVAGVGNEIAISVGILPEITGNMVAVASVYQNGVAANGRVVASIAFPNRFIMSGGQAFGCQVDQATSTLAQTMSLEVMYVRLND